MGAKTVTAEEATEALVEERRTAMQATADQEEAVDVAELERQNALVEIQNRAETMVDQRDELLTRFVEALEQVSTSATELRDLRDEYGHLNARARKLGSHIKTKNVKTRAFGIDPKERQLLRGAIQILSSIGGYV